jgi:hypothetical protein
MLYRPLIASALLVGVALPAFAAQPAPAASTPAQQAANHDFGKFSAQGFAAFADIRQARLAIFNGDPGVAKKDIGAAAAALQKAQTDGTVFMKAEADLTPPQGTTEPNPDNNQPGTTAVKWLPIDGAMVINEDYTGNAAKTAGVAKADAQLKAGHKSQALQTLKLAAVDVSFNLEVAPLAQSMTWVNDAERLADAGQYFEANQALKHAQDGIRFDVQTVATAPAPKTADASAAGHAAKTNS